MTKSGTSQNRRNPRQGIETRVPTRADTALATSQNRRNPRQGIETIGLHELEDSQEYIVRIDEIPVRGLKQRVAPPLGTLVPGQNRRNPRQGIETPPLDVF